MLTFWKVLTLRPPLTSPRSSKSSSPSIAELHRRRRQMFRGSSMKMTTLPLLSAVLVFLLSPNLVASELKLEPGYYVSTVFDFNKLQIPSTVHTFALLPFRRSTAGDDALLLLDSAHSVFYTIQLPISQGSEVGLFSGKGGAGFSDGDKAAAMFNKPQSFAIDDRDNVYVTDQMNRAIRKISSSGISTTIAGAYSEKTGHVDGPAQNASFSANFDLVYIPTKCELLIADHGNRLIRQMKLKPEDCAQKTKAGLGAAPVSAIAILFLLLGLALGFVARPYFFASQILSNWTWKHYLTNLGRPLMTACCGVRSAIANSALTHHMLRLINISIAYLSLVFQISKVENHVPYGVRKETPLREKAVPVSLSLLDVTLPLLDLGPVSDSDTQNPDPFDKQLQTIPDEGVGTAETNERADVLEGSSSKIDHAIEAHLADFSNLAKLQAHRGDSDGTGLVRRRSVKANDQR